MFCVWVEHPMGMFSVGSFPLLADIFIQLQSKIQLHITSKSIILISFSVFETKYISSKPENV